MFNLFSKKQEKKNEILVKQEIELINNELITGTYSIGQVICNLYGADKYFFGGIIGKDTIVINHYNEWIVRSSSTPYFYPIVDNLKITLPGCSPSITIVISSVDIINGMITITEFKVEKEEKQF